MTNKPAQRLALLFFLLTVAELGLLASLAPLDAAVAQWIEAHRSCELDYAAFLIKDRPLELLFLLGGLTLAALSLRSRWKEARHLLLTVLVGSFFCELLKTALERARPSVLPQLIVGNSFPSGHVTTALFIAGALGFLLWRSRQSHTLKVGGTVILGLLAAATTWQRLYLGHHWCTDIIGSVLLVGAWLCFALSRPQLFSLARRSVMMSGCLLASYACFYFFPALRFPLLSAHTGVGEPVVALSFGEDGSRQLARGSWGDHTREPAGPVTWLNQEEASVEVLLPQPQNYLLKIAIRPMVQSKAFACFPLEIAVNHRHTNRLLLYRGWREYAVHLDAKWLVPGQNLITFHADPRLADQASEQRTVAFHYLRLFAEQADSP